MRSLLIRCYPATWQERYGDEFLAILEARPLGPSDVVDVLLGALDARRRARRPRGATSSTRTGAPLRSLRIGGLAAIVGAFLWLTASLLNLVVVSADVPIAMLITGLLMQLIAVGGLSAFQARTYPGGVWAAFVVTAIGNASFLVGYVGSIVIGGDGFWGFWFVGLVTILVGSGLFAVVTFLSSVPSRRGALLIGIGIATIVIANAIPSVRLTSIGMVCFALGWLAIGLQAIRMDGPATAAA